MQWPTRPIPDLQGSEKVGPRLPIITESCYSDDPFQFLIMEYVKVTIIFSALQLPQSFAPSDIHVLICHFMHLNSCTPDPIG